MYKKEIKIPQDVSVEISNNKAAVKGPKGELEKRFKLAYGIKIEKVDGIVIIKSESDKRKAKALVGTITAHINNMIKGVTEGFLYKLKITYSHFPMNVKVDGDKVITQNFLGERTSRIAKIVGNTQVKIEGQDVTITGLDIEEVGLTASKIEQSCRIVGYDKRRFSDGIYLVSGKK